MRLVLEVFGTMAATMAKERERVAEAMTAAAREFAEMGKADLRRDTRAGFDNGARISKVWDAHAYPQRAGANSITPAAYFFVRGDFDHVISAFAEPAVIRGRFGPFIIIPTPQALAAGLKPDNRTRRGAMGRFKRGAVGRNWAEAAEQKWGWLMFVPHKDGQPGGYMVARNKRSDPGFPIFYVVSSARLQKRIHYQKIFTRLQRQWPRYLVQRLGRLR